MKKGEGVEILFPKIKNAARKKKFLQMFETSVF